MDAQSGREATPTQERTTMERTSERELVVTRTIDGPAHIVFGAWTEPEQMKRWWVPKSVPITLLSCEMDVRVGGTYRFVFQVDPTTTMAFFGRYLEVSPPSRLVWTNEEGEGDAVVTTVTFDEDQGRTRLSCTISILKGRARWRHRVGGRPRDGPRCWNQLGTSCSVSWTPAQDGHDGGT